MEKDAKIKEIELKERQTLLNNLFIIVAALVVSISVVLYGFRIKTKLNQKLKNKMK